MNELELKRIRKSQAVIAKIAVDGKKAGLSYGQLQAQRYEQQQKLGSLQKRIVEEQQQQKLDTKREGKGRPKMPMPESFVEAAEMMLSHSLSRKKASIMFNVAPQTVQNWLDEYVSNSNSCRK